MRGRKLFLVGSLVAAFVVGSFLHPASAEETSGSSQRERTTDALTKCIKQSHQLSVLFLVDESRSLGGPNGTDGNNLRVEGMVEALNGLEELRSTLASRADVSGNRALNIEIRIDGFGDEYLAGNSGDWEMLSATSLPGLISAANQFADRNKKYFTDYRIAMEGASGAFAELEDETCRMLFWFTDGEYDSDNGNPQEVDDEEKEEIRTTLCGKGGLVDTLRDQGVAILAFALSAGANPPNTDLVKAIAEGGDHGIYSCGAAGQYGIFTMGSSAEDLIKGFAALLTDTIFEAQENPNGQTQLGCQKTTGDVEQCVIDFQLGPWTETFDLYLEVPPNREFEILVQQPDGTEVHVQNLNANSGVSFNAPSTSWRLLSGSATEIENWDGWWKLILKGPGSEDATATIKFAFDELLVAADESLRINRSEPESYSEVPLVVTAGQKPLTAESLSEGGGLRLTVIAVLPGGRTISKLVTSSAEGDTRVLIPESFIKEALEGSEKFIPSLELQVTPEVAIGREGAGGYVYHEYAPSSFRYWLYDQILIELDEPSLSLDRDEPETLEGIEVSVTVNGEPLVLDEGTLTLRFVASFHGGEEIKSKEVQVTPGGTASIPSDFLDEAIREDGPGANLVLLRIEAIPTLTIMGDGETATHPGHEPSALQFGVRTGSGYPDVYEVTATDIKEQGSSRLTIRGTGPDEGAGVLEILSLANLPEGLEGTLALKETVTCHTPIKEPFTCIAEITTNFDASMKVEFSVVIALDGDQAEKGRKESNIQVSLNMKRSVDVSVFTKVAFMWLGIFLFVQLLLAAVTATLLSRWAPMPPLSRSINLAVRVSPEGLITAQGGGALFIEPGKTQFVNQLEKPAGHADVDGVAFSIKWSETFIGKAGLGLLGIQREMITTSVPGAHCFGPEGQKLVKETGVGLVGTSLQRSWSLWLTSADLLCLAAGESVDATLLLVLVDFSSEPFEEQLEKVSDKIDTVMAREIPRVIGEMTKAPEQAKEETSGEGAVGSTIPDDFDLDPLLQKSVKTEETENEFEDWPSDPDDLLA